MISNKSYFATHLELSIDRSSFAFRVRVVPCFSEEKELFGPQCLWGVVDIYLHFNSANNCWIADKKGHQKTVHIPLFQYPAPRLQKKGLKKLPFLGCSVLKLGIKCAYLPHCKHFSSNHEARALSRVEPHALQNQRLLRRKSSGTTFHPKITTKTFLTFKQLNCLLMTFHFNNNMILINLTLQHI